MTGTDTRPRGRDVRGLREAGLERDRRRRGRRLIGALGAELSTEAYAANRRAADALSRYRDPGDYYRWVSRAIADAGEEAVPEVADLFGEIKRRDREVARTLLDRVERDLEETGPTHLKPRPRGAALGPAGRPPVPMKDVLAGLRDLVEEDEELDPPEPTEDSLATIRKATGFAVRPGAKGRVQFLSRDGRTPFLSLSPEFARRLADDADDYAGRLALLEGLRSGRLKGAELDAEARRRLIKHYGPDLVLGGEADREDRTAYEAFKEAERQLAKDGGKADAVIAALVPALLPELDDPDVIRDLILDSLPIVGNVRGAMSAVEDAGAAFEALRDGDWGRAGKLGLFSALDAAGAVPGAGLLFKPLARAARRAVRTMPKVEKYLAQQRVGRALDRFDRRIEETRIKDFVGADVWEGLSDSLRADLNLALNRVKGNVTENEMAEALQRAGFSLLRNSNKGLKVSARVTGSSKPVDRVYDLGLGEKYDRTWDGRAVPGRSGMTVIEVKSDNAELKRRQKEIDKKTREGMVENMSGDVIDPDSLAYMRLGLHQVPEDKVVEAATKQFTKAIKGEHIPKDDVEKLVRSSYRKQRVKQTTLGEFLAAMYRLNLSLVGQGSPSY